MKKIFLLSILVLSLSACSINFGVERSKTIPLRVNYSVTHYRPQEDKAVANSYVPSYINLKQPNTVYIKTSDATQGQCSPDAGPCP